MTLLVRILRIGGFLCFVGHGAFGVITKEAWVPYFAVGGIDRAHAFALMPVVGWFDIATGFLVLLSPRPLIVWWMLVWTIWTALVRPLAGEPVWEALERAGNYGVPAALLCALTPVSLRRWRDRSEPKKATPPVLRAIRMALVAACVLLLVGHGMLSIHGKAGIVRNLASISPLHAATLTPILGWCEIGLAIAVAVLPSVPMLLVVAVWKVLTESLFIAAGSSWWELVERGGSYAVPLALMVVLAMTSQRPGGPARDP